MSLRAYGHATQRQAATNFHSNNFPAALQALLAPRAAQRPELSPLSSRAAAAQSILHVIRQNHPTNFPAGRQRHFKRNLSPGR